MSTAIKPHVSRKKWGCVASTILPQMHVGKPFKSPKWRPLDQRPHGFRNVSHASGWMVDEEQKHHPNLTIACIKTTNLPISCYPGTVRIRAVHFREVSQPLGPHQAYPEEPTVEICTSTPAFDLVTKSTLLSCLPTPLRAMVWESLNIKPEKPCSLLCTEMFDCEACVLIADIEQTRKKEVDIYHSWMMEDIFD